MAKVTINDKPVAAEAAKANAETIVTDARGRRITIGEPDFLAQFRLTEAVGSSASNEQYMNMVRPLLYVKEIDGDHIFSPSTKPQVEALIQRLGAEGYSALGEALVEKYVGDDNTPEAQAARLKK